MNNFGKNIAVWVIISLVLIAIFNVFQGNSSKSSNNAIAYSDFLARVNSVTGLLEAKGPLVDRYKKIRYFNGDLHSYDVMLFWGCLRKNIKDRINAFI